MKIKKTTKRYERWLRQQMPLLAPDIALKHQAMANDPFSFLRATFYRWVQVWPRVCPEATAAPAVLAVGDLHVENFGTWRDIEGRLIWGVNDFDEVYRMPYTIDLVRLAASAHLAIAGAHLALRPKDACDAILTGYSEALTAGGRPFVLSEQFKWLRIIASGELRDPVHFWEKMSALPKLRTKAPKAAVKALEQMLPEPGLPYRLVKRIAGLGSLGRHRVVALAEWRGAKIAREAKALAPSAYNWQRPRSGNAVLYQKMLDRAVRCSDPFVRVQGGWLVRRLAPDCSRIELASLPKERDEARLLHAMGWETANIHLGSHKAVDALRRDLRRRDADWLNTESKKMAEVTTTDFEAWKTQQAASTK